MHCFRFNQEDVQLATTRAHKMGIIKHNFSGLSSVVTGFLGEHILNRELVSLFGQESTRIADTRNYDILCCGVKIEVKSREAKSTRIRGDYLNCVSAHNPSQDCDIYTFLRVQYETGRQSGWVSFCGSIRSKVFHSICEYTPKNTVKNGLPIKHDCFCIPVSKCVSFRSLISELRQFKKHQETNLKTNKTNKTRKRKKKYSEANQKERQYGKNKTQTKNSKENTQVLCKDACNSEKNTQIVFTANHNHNCRQEKETIFATAFQIFTSPV